MLDGIAQLIATLEGLVFSETAEANVFVGHLPSTPDRCVAVYSQVSEEADSKLPYDPVAFTVIARSEQDGVWARDTTAAIYSRLHGKRNTTLPDGTYVVFILAESASPLPLGPDEAHRTRLSVEYRSEVINTTEERP